MNGFDTRNVFGGNLERLALSFVKNDSRKFKNAVADHDI